MKVSTNNNCLQQYAKWLCHGWGVMTVCRRETVAVRTHSLTSRMKEQSSMVAIWLVAPCGAH